MRSHRETVVVIGAGLAGLTAAIALARRGLPVTVVEATGSIGGCCSVEERAGYRFNNGAVYVAVPTLLRRVFDTLGLDFDAEVPLVPIRRPHAAYLDSGSVVRLSSADDSVLEGRDAERRTARMREGLARLCRDWRPIYRRLVDDILPHEPSLLRTLGRLYPYLPRMSGKADRVIDRYFDDDDVRAAVASMLLYTGVGPGSLPAAQIIGLIALLEDGMHLPVDGMGAISNALGRAADSLGVSLRLNTVVERVVVRQGRVAGVMLDDGEMVQASHVISTCSAFALAKTLLAPAEVPRRLAGRAAAVPLSHRAIAIQLGCRATAMPDAFVVAHVPPLEQQGTMHLSQPGVPRWFAYTQPTAELPGLAPQGASILELYAPVSGVAHAREWTPAMTESAVENHLEALRAKLPGLAIETVRVLDPNAFATQRHLYEGALYGVLPGTTPDKLFPHRSGIEGLFLAGQTTPPGYGVGPAMQSGILAADALLAG